MMIHVTHRFAGAGFLLLGALASADAQSARGFGGGVDRVLSPAVVATWISHELLEYLRCDVRLPDPTAQEQMAFLCAQVFGRCDVRLTNPALQAMLDASCLR
jgi:hypothetical protein